MRKINANICFQDFKRCFTLADTGKYDVLVINVHQLKNPKEQLQEFRKKYPAITTIVVEERDDPSVGELFWHPPLADYRFGVKKYMEITKLGELVQSIMDDFCGKIRIELPNDINSILSLYADSWSGPRRVKQTVSLRAAKRDLRIILRKIFFDYRYDTSQEQKDSPITRRIEVSSLGEAGKSASCMFKVCPKDMISEKVPKSAVLKFGPKEDVRIESWNYDKYVEWFLDYEQTVRKISYAEGNSFGGILYSFLPDSIPFAEFVRKQETDKCCNLIRRMFGVSNQHWLSVDGNRYVKPEDALFGRYYISKVLHASLHEMINDHFGNLQKAINNLERKSGQYGILIVGDNKITFPSLHLSIPNPIDFLSKPLVDQLKFTIIHGDLHAHNILINESFDELPKYQFIDFYYTGFGDIYRDFTELELSIRYDLFSSGELPNEDRLTASDNTQTNTNGLKKLVMLERSLIDTSIYRKNLRKEIIDDPRLLKAHKIISEIRKMAFENYDEKERLYYMGLSFSSLKALKYFYPIDVKLYRLIISGLYISALSWWDNH
jgi:hypothetical protein